MKDQEPKQLTPQGHEIPIPTREEFKRNLGKTVRPPDSARGPASGPPPSDLTSLSKGERQHG